MKKKAKETVKGSAPKSIKAKSLPKPAAGLEQSGRGARPMKVSEDPRFSQAVQNYEAGLKALQAHKYDKAKTYFEKVVAGPSPELADRASVHLHSCNQQMSRASNTFKTAEEQYDYAVSLMNLGDYVTAREQLDKLLKQAPKAEYVLYGLAALHCLTGHVEESLKTLNDAIRLKPALRFQARNDGDFQNLAEDPRFTELLYPDPGVEAEVPEDASAY